MSFRSYLIKQLECHTSMQPEDVVKLCYQASCGAEHLLLRPDEARDALYAEFASVDSAQGVLYEQISDSVCRVNLSAWKKKDLPIQWLFAIFSASCRAEKDAEKKLETYLQIVEETLDTAPHSFTKQQWDEYLAEYKRIGMPAVSHSESYRKKEKPAYRIANVSFCRAFDILEKAKGYLNTPKPCIIAIDGRTASGKTTLANTLSIALDAAVIRMDDFFLPPELRSPKRFETPGNNVHHERFSSEVLPYLSGRDSFSYRIFDCGIRDYNGTAEVKGKHFRIVEGSYSCHPVFGDYADITVFSDVAYEVQKERILHRNGEAMLVSFVERWIPLEEEYFTYYTVKDKCDITL